MDKFITSTEARKLLDAAADRLDKARGHLDTGYAVLEDRAEADHHARQAAAHLNRAGYLIAHVRVAVNLPAEMREEAVTLSGAITQEVHERHELVARFGLVPPPRRRV